MKGKRTARRSKRTQRTDWKRVQRMTDAEIDRAIEEDPDAAPRLDADWFKNARLVPPDPKVPISLRMDREVLDWFRRGGPRYQTRINAVLRAFMEAHRK